ncbi:MAG: hypothetical protein JWM68_4375 [Verrucomicrobiales bacterium]|nr:hypothetical protein [Verrucomicrobiales bacterium]
MKSYAHIRAVAFTALCIVGLGTGCTTYQQQNKSMAQKWDTGNVPGAVEEFGLKAEKAKETKDAIIWRLEHAAALRAAQQFKESNDAFEKAEEKILKYDESAKVKLGHEAGALMSNQANLPYEGRMYDKIMLSTYKALNDLQLGDLDKARVDLNRVYKWQEDAVALNAARLEKAQEGNKEKEKTEKAQQDEKFKTQMDGAYKGLDEVKVYGDYVNPFSVYLDALYFMNTAAGSSDLEHASKSLERVASFAAENKFIKQDQETMKELLAGKPMSPVTYVVFETGGAPIREQIRIDIPILVAKVSYVGAAFPKLKFENDYVPALTVSANGTNETTQLIASMDSVVAQDFKNELPIIITKTLVSTIAKAVAAYAVNEAASKQDSMVGLFAKLATAATQAAMNIADLRTWTTLPKEYQICRVATPADRKVELAAGAQRIPVTVGDGLVNLVFVKSINSRSPLLVSQAKLR